MLRCLRLVEFYGLQWRLTIALTPCLLDGVRPAGTTAGLIALQALLGLVFPELYRDEGFVRETWFGNDWVTLLLGVPALLAGGILLWCRNPWGYVIAVIVCIKSVLYLTLLSLNSWLLIQRGMAEAPGELPMWGTLAVLTFAATVTLLVNIQGRENQA